MARWIRHMWDFICPFPHPQLYAQPRTCTVTVLHRVHFYNQHFQINVPAPGAFPPILGACIEACRFVYESPRVIESGIRKVSFPLLIEQIPNPIDK